MRKWDTTKVDDIRVGNVISYGGITDEVTKKYPSGMGGNTSVFLELCENDTLELWQDTLIEVYR